MRAEHLPEPAVGALGDQVDVHLADRGQEAVGVVLLPDAAAGKPEPQPVAERQRPALRNAPNMPGTPSGVIATSGPPSRTHSAETASGW